MRPRLPSLFSIGLLLTLFPFIVPAQNEPTGQPGQSVLYQRQSPDYGHLTTLPDEAKGAGAGGDHCADLLRRVDELKGKPQRRSTAMARYEAECQRDSRQP